MLDKIVFIINKEDAKQEMEALLGELRECQIKAFWFEAFDSSIDFFLQNLSADAAWEDTLFVTDAAKDYQMLRRNNRPVVVWLHEQNREETFPQAEYAIENLHEIAYQSLELAYLRLTGQPWKIAETKRCIIRESVVEDVDSFYEIYADESITEYMEDLYADRDEEIAYLHDYIKNVYAFYGYGMWTVLEKESGQVIGRAGISLREGSDIPELGFMIGVAWQRQGYAYEACQAVLAYGEEELDFHCFQALVMKGNEKSRKLCEKLGFVFVEDVEMDGTIYERMLMETKKL